MKLLLDTHIWLWSILMPERLSPKVRRALLSSGNELWLSPVSTWELTVLCAKGRVVLKEDVALWLAKALAPAASPHKDGNLDLNSACRHLQCSPPSR